MKTTHIPERMCAVCMQMQPKTNMVRLTKNIKGQIIIDTKQKLGGRGVWIDKTQDCLAKLKKRKVLERKFKCVIPENLFKELEEYVNGTK